MLRKILNDDQIAFLRSGVEKWSDETITKALKFRFALNMHGYEYLLQTNYPLPSVNTINMKIREFKVDFSIFEDVLQALKYKVEAMTSSDRYCLLSIDHMEINQKLNCDKNVQILYRTVTFGKKKSQIGTHILLVVCRGLKQNWKQIIAAHVTENLIDGKLLKEFLDDCIRFVEETGLRVIALSSNTKPNYRSVWNEYCCYVKQDGTRNNAFQSNNHDIFIIPDVCHILNNLRIKILTSVLHLPEGFVKCEKLPTAEVSGKYILNLWTAQIGTKKEISSLCHLNKRDLYLDNIQTVNFDSAVQIFSLKTATGLELGVQQKILPQEALTTAKFIKIVGNWFRIMTAKKRRTSITRCNKTMRYGFLHKVIDLFQNTRIGTEWDSLNVDVVMSSLSICDIGDFLLENNFDFLITYRFTLDCVENIFSQIRKKRGSMPCASICLQIIRSITLSQFSSDIKRSSYTNKTDEFLLNLISDADISTETNVTDCIAPKKIHTELPVTVLDTFRLDNEILLQPIMNMFDLNTVYNIGHNITKDILQICCDSCNNFLKSTTNNDIIDNNSEFYKNFVDMGGLTDPSQQLIELIVNCEIYFQKFKNYILHNSSDILIYKLYNELSIDFPTCCNIKQELISQFLKIRSFAAVTFRTKAQKRKKLCSNPNVKKNKK